MRKATTGMLVAAMFAVAGVAQSADRAGVGLEWGIGPRISFGTFDMSFTNGASLNWNIGGDFMVGVFNNSGMYRGEYSYTNNTVTPNITDKITQTGSISESGIQILHSIPGLSFLAAGLSLGAVTYGTSTVKYYHSDGSAGAPADFPGSGVVAATTAAEIGIDAKATLLRAESKLVTTTVNVNAGLHFVDLPDTVYFGTQEFNSTSTPKKGIDPVSSNHNLALSVSVGLSF